MKYFEDWEDSKKKGMMEDFGITAKDLQGCTIIFAAYNYEDYSGSAFVLFEKDGKLFEVNGSHCSCYGLGGDGDGTQWEPEETSWKFLAQRTDILSTYSYTQKTIDVLKKLIAKNQEAK